MKAYTVVWWPPVKRELADLWIASSDRQRIANAADEIDRLLANTPAEVGESGAEGFRRLFVSPLFVEFTVIEGDRTAKVVSVKLTN